MDLFGLAEAERQEALLGIERISHWPGQRAPLLNTLQRILGPPGPKRLKLIELGAGSGHLARWISGELAARGYDAEVLATDLVAHAGVKKLDCLKGTLPAADLYYSSLLLHHLKDEEVARMLRLQAAKARLGFVHFDLQRNLLHFYLAKILTRLGGFHRINQVDALRSIQQGYIRSELKALSSAAGLASDIRWSFPFRWLLSWKR
jgi:hypothetical protein